MTNRGVRQRIATMVPRDNEDGQALIELALSVSFLFVMLFGAFEFGTAVYAGIEVSNAAMAGVQYGSQSTAAASDLPGIRAAAAADAPNITLGTTNAVVTGICASGNACTGNNNTCQSTDCSTPGDHIESILTVTTTTAFTPGIRLPGFASTYTLQGQAVQKVSP